MSVTRMRAHWAVATSAALGLLVGAHPAVAQSGSSRVVGPPLDVQQDVQRPVSLEDMLVNLRLAISRRYLVREDFYTDSNVLQVFGGSRVIRQDYGTSRRGQIVGFAGWVGPPNLGGPVVDGIS